MYLCTFYVLYWRPRLLNNDNFRTDSLSTCYQINFQNWETRRKYDNNYIIQYDNVSHGIWHGNEPKYSDITFNHEDNPTTCTSIHRHCNWIILSSRSRIRIRRYWLLQNSRWWILSKHIHTRCIRRYNCLLGIFWYTSTNGRIIERLRLVAIKRWMVRMCFRCRLWCSKFHITWYSQRSTDFNWIGSYFDFWRMVNIDWVL